MNRFFVNTSIAVLFALVGPAAFAGQLITCKSVQNQNPANLKIKLEFESDSTAVNFSKSKIELIDYYQTDSDYGRIFRSLTVSVNTDKNTVVAFVDKKADLEYDLHFGKDLAKKAFSGERADLVLIIDGDYADPLPSRTAFICDGKIL